jgi:flagellum-specific ATP synthase
VHRCAEFGIELFSAVADREHRAQAGKVRELLAAYEKAEDLINIGAYQMGSNRTIDLAITRHEEIIDFLKQEREDEAHLSDSIEKLLQIKTV